MRPAEIADANERIVARPLSPKEGGVVVREIVEPSILLVLPLAHAEALSACANVGLEGVPDRAVGDLTWASVSKLDAAVMAAKTSPVDEPEEGVVPRDATGAIDVDRIAAEKAAAGRRES